MRYLFTLILLSLFFSVFAQEKAIEKIFSIEIKDSENLRPVATVNVRYSCDKTHAILKSDSLGNAQIACDARQMNLSLSAEFYKTQSNVILRADRAIKQLGDTLFFAIYLEPKATKTMIETVVKNPYQPQEIFASERLSVADFEILDDDNILLLTYERKLNKGAELLLVDANEKVQFNKTLGGDALHLLRDFRGFVHLMYKNRLDYVYLTDDAFDLVSMDKPYFDRYVAPIIDTSKTKFYFTNYRETYPAADFFIYDDLDSTYLKISRVSDEIMMDMFIKEYLWVDVRTKLWAREMEQKTGMDKEDIVGEAIFTQSIFYKEIYAPLFLKNDTVYLFDFYKDYLRKYDRNGNPLDSVAISMHHHPKKTGWCNRILQDPKTGSIYAIFDKGGYSVIRALNLDDGTLGVSIRLDFRYVDKLIVHDNALYYTYRPFESNQKKFLYRQLLPLYFNENKTGVDKRIPDLVKQTASE